MIRYKISEHLYLDEIVPVKLYDAYARKNKLYKLAYRFDKTLIDAYEIIHEHLGTIGVINNWWSTYVRNDYDAEKTHNEVESNELLYQWSGLRLPESSVYSTNSIHNFYKAFDVKWGGLSNTKPNKDAQTLIKKYWRDLGFGGLEIKRGWTHMDTRFVYKQKELMIF